MWLIYSWNVLLLLFYIFIADCVTQIIIYQDIQYLLSDDGAVINQSSILETSTIRGWCAKSPFIILMMILQMVIALHTCGIARLVDDLL